MINNLEFDSVFQELRRLALIEKRPYNRRRRGSIHLIGNLAHQEFSNYIAGLRCFLIGTHSSDIEIDDCLIQLANDWPKVDRQKLAKILDYLDKVRCGIAQKRLIKMVNFTIPTREVR
jgi:hypothetical protein